MSEEMQCCALDRATGLRCPQRGVPDPEFPDLFTCDGHLNELEYWLNYFAGKDRDKHDAN